MVLYFTARRGPPMMSILGDAEPRRPMPRYVDLLASGAGFIYADAVPSGCKVAAHEDDASSSC